MTLALQVHQALSPGVTYRHEMCVFRGVLRRRGGRFHLPSPPVTCGGVPFEYHKKPLPT